MIFGATSTNAQTDTTDLSLFKYKNVAHVSISPIGLLSCNYERIIFDSEKREYFNLYFRFGVGGYSFWGSSALFNTAQISMLVGKRKHFFESSAGVGYQYNFHEYNPLEFALPLSLGYRIQNTKKRFMFRGGIGFPEYIFIGGGICF
jgi:hypothetical protein